MLATPRPGPVVTGEGGVALATWDLGGDGDPVLLTHGTGLHAWMWLGAAPELAAAGRRVWAVDLRGHGASGPSPDGTYRDWWAAAADLTAVVAALGLERPAGVGHSFGAACLAMAELDRPGTFASLWLWEPIIPPPDDPADEGGPPLAEVARRRKGRFESVEAAVANFRGRPPFAAVAPGLLEAYVEHAFAPEAGGGVHLVLPGEAEATCYEGAALHGAWDRLGELDVPVTLAGAGDEVSPPARWLDPLAGRIRGARLRRWPDLTHFGPMEDPAAVGRAAAADLASTGAVPPPR